MPTIDEIHLHVDIACADDPRQALMAVRKLLDVDVPFLERRAVQLARHDGWAWVRISRLLMRSRQAVRQRFGHASVRGRFDPVPAFESDDEVARRHAEAERWLERFREAHARAVAAESPEPGSAA